MEHLEPAGGILIGGIDTPGPIWRVPEAGGEASAVTPDDGAFYLFPQFLPDGRRFLYMRLAPGAGPEVIPAGVHIGSLDAPPEAQISEALLVADGQVLYVPDDSGGGRLLFLRRGQLLSQEFDVRRLTLSGEPVLVAADVGNFGRSGHVTVSASGTLAYLSRAGEEYLRWFDRTRTPLEIIDESTHASVARVERTGTRVAFDRAESPGNSDIGIADQATGITTRLTFEPGADEFPI